MEQVKGKMQSGEKNRLSGTEAFVTSVWGVVLLANICCALWGSAFACIRTGYEWLDIRRTSDQIVFAGIRFTLAGVQLFAAYLIVNRRICRLPGELFFGVFRLGIMQTFVQYIFYYIGVAHTTGVKGSVINSANSFFLILLAHFFRKGERLDAKKITGCLFGIAGVIVINLGGDFGGSFKLTGEGFILLACLAYAMASLMSQKLSQGKDPMVITCYNFLFGGSCLLLAGLLMGGTIPHFTLKSFVLLFYMGMISAGAFTVWTLLLKYNPVGRIAIFGFLIPVYGCVSASLFLGEVFFKPENAAALVLVCIGIVIVNRQPKRKES